MTTAGTLDDPKDPSYVPLAMRHGDREERHIKHLGLIEDPSAAVSSPSTIPRPPQTSGIGAVEVPMSVTPPKPSADARAERRRQLAKSKQMKALPQASRATPVTTPDEATSTNLLGGVASLFGGTGDSTTTQAQPQPQSWPRPQTQPMPQPEPQPQPQPQPYLEGDVLVERDHDSAHLDELYEPDELLYPDLDPKAIKLIARLGAYAHPPGGLSAPHAARVQQMGTLSLAKKRKALLREDFIIGEPGPSEKRVLARQMYPSEGIIREPDCTPLSCVFGLPPAVALKMMPSLAGSRQEPHAVPTLEDIRNSAVKLGVWFKPPAAPHSAPVPPPNPHLSTPAPAPPPEPAGPPDPAAPPHRPDPVPPLDQAPPPPTEAATPSQTEPDFYDYALATPPRQGVAGVRPGVKGNIPPWLQNIQDAETIASKALLLASGGANDSDFYSNYFQMRARATQGQPAAYLIAKMQPFSYEEIYGMRLGIDHSLSKVPYKTFEHNLVSQYTDYQTQLRDVTRPTHLPRYSNLLMALPPELDALTLVADPNVKSGVAAAIHANSKVREVLLEGAHTMLRGLGVGEAILGDEDKSKFQDGLPSVLHIKVLKAMALPGSESISPYVIVSVMDGDPLGPEARGYGDAKKAEVWHTAHEIVRDRTPAIKNARSPEWGAEIKLQLPVTKTQYLHLQIMSGLDGPSLEIAQTSVRMDDVLQNHWINPRTLTVIPFERTSQSKWAELLDTRLMITAKISRTQNQVRQVGGPPGISDVLSAWKVVRRFSRSDFLKGARERVVSSKTKQVPTVHVEVLDNLEALQKKQVEARLAARKARREEISGVHVRMAEPELVQPPVARRSSDGGKGDGESDDEDHRSHGSVVSSTSSAARAHSVGRSLSQSSRLSALASMQRRSTDSGSNQPPRTSSRGYQALRSIKSNKLAAKVAAKKAEASSDSAKVVRQPTLIVDSDFED